jgi:glycosyltransferase involved in cell wall biosynthesis
MLFVVPGRIGGLESYARGLVSGLAQVDSGHEFVILANRENAETWSDLPENFYVHECPVNGESKVARTLYEERRLNGAARRLGVEILHSLYHVAPPPAPGLISVATIPDIIFTRFPREFGPVRRAVAGYLVRRTARLCHRILTLSEFSRREIHDVLRAPVEKIDVTPLAAVDLPEQREEADAFFRQCSIAEPYLFSVASTYYHKNLGGLLRAYALLRERHRVAHRLVVSGLKMAAHDEFVAAVRAMRLEDCVTFTGWAPPAALRALYERAACFVFPSLYEGFGLPPLEAMALGAPVACSNTTSLPEVVGDAAALFDPASPESMAEAIHRVLEDAPWRQSLIAKGRARAALFSWDECARLTLESYRRAGAD